MRNQYEIPMERPKMGEDAAVIVPKLEHQIRVGHQIDPGSGIVACAMYGADDQLLIYFEGNRFNASNIVSLEDRAIHAYGRMATRYPTIALAVMPLDLFDVVGRINSKTFEIDASHPAVLAWTEHDPKLLERSIYGYQSRPNRNFRFG